MNRIDAFIGEVLSAAAKAGIGTAEVYWSEGESFSVEAMEGAIEHYEVSESHGLSLRGTVDGRMGYAATQAIDEQAVGELVRGVLESAALAEDEEQDEIFAGEDAYPDVAEPENDLDKVPAEERIALCLAAEKAALAADSRIARSEGASLSVSRVGVRIRNSLGLDLACGQSLFTFGCGVVAKDDGSTSTGFKVLFGRKLGEVRPEEVGAAAAEDALGKLHASPVAAGTWRVVIRRDAMRSLLGTFAGVFSAENAQQKMSLLAGREGETIAAPCLTLMDDPLLPGGFASRPFDAEGSAARTKAVIEDGVLKTLLHSRKTARKQGVETTGNASRAGYAAPVHVSPSNFFIKPGERTLEEMTASLDRAVLITEVGGLHAGANPVSGDFSLLSRGFLIENGRIVRPVEQITVAGNFYTLLRQIREVGSDLEFRGALGCPSVDAGELTVSGK